MEQATKILKNVFLNTRENYLVPVNIYYNNSILKIIRLIKDEIHWDDISTISQKEKLIISIKHQVFPSGTKVIDGKFNLVIPGAVDPHVHFDTPGFEFRDTFKQGTTAAAFGGVTTIIDMPCTSIPPVTSLENFEEKLNAVKNKALVDFAFWGGVRGNDFENGLNIERNISDLNEAGVASYKAYLISGMETFKDLSFDQMKWTAEQIANTGKPLGVHAEDKNLVVSRRLAFRENNKNSWQHYCQARDSFAERAAINDMISIARTTDARVHIVHLSSKQGLEAVSKAKIDTVRITAETCPHYLQFTQNDFNNSRIRNFLKTAPPVKHNDDRKALWDGLRNNTLIFVTTDHAGCDPEKEKESENFWEVYGGIPGVEHRVPYLFSEGFIKNRISLEQTIEVLSKNVAEYFNLKLKGRISENYDADFALINLWNQSVVESEEMHSKGKYTPFEGIKLNAEVEMTILRGNIIMNKLGSSEKDIGYGKFIEVYAP